MSVTGGGVTTGGGVVTGAGAGAGGGVDAGGGVAWTTGAGVSGAVAHEKPKSITKMNKQSKYFFIKNLLFKDYSFQSLILAYYLYYASEGFTQNWAL
jgi:hypothetical protein